MDTDDRLPALRAIEILPFQKDGEIYFGLRDPAQLAARPIAISAAGCFVLAHLDGLHTCADIRAAARQQTGMELPESEILNLVHVLEEGLFLQGERVTGALAERRAAYAAAPVRDNRDRYPAAGVLRSEIEQMIAGGARGPGQGRTRADRAPSRLWPRPAVLCLRVCDVGTGAAGRSLCHSGDESLWRLDVRRRDNQGLSDAT